MIMAGGTGGHIYPALAVAELLQKKGCEVFWMGTPNGMESTIIPKYGIAMHCVSISGLRGKGITSLAMAPIKLVIALSQAGLIILKKKPDVVLGMGGFVTGPGGLMSWFLRKPLVIHEQNAIAGMTNRLLSKIANRVLEAFPRSFGKNVSCQLTGNPIRGNVLNVSEPGIRLKSHSGNLRILVIGGSLGAVAINQVLPKALKRIDEAVRPEVWHQVGKKNIEQAEHDYGELAVSAKVVPFIENMGEAYEWADIVLCRAGALTIAEIMSVGIASILVPYPYAVDDHQSKNASFLLEKKAAILLPQDQLDEVKLADNFMYFENNRQELLEMAESAKSCGIKNSAEQVADICMGVLQ